jgi:triacylglycerol lipase
MDDCYAGLRWVHAHADELGVDPARIGIGGASAGGGLAAGLALLARDRGEVPLAFQLLIYPMIDDRRVTPSSAWEVPIWPPSANEFGWASYLSAAGGDGAVPAYAAPARAVDVGGLPDALVVVGMLDGFLDEDVIYAQRMMQAGVPVELHVYPGAPHGFDGFAPDAAVARQCRRDVNGWLARVLAR